MFYIVKYNYFWVLEIQSLQQDEVVSIIIGYYKTSKKETLLLLVTMHLINSTEIPTHKGEQVEIKVATIQTTV